MAPLTNRELDNTVVVSNLPVVDGDILPLLQAAFRNKASSAISSELSFKEEAFEVPADDNNYSMGFGFVTCPSAAEARAVRKLLQGFRFDKNHILATCLLSEVDELASAEPEDPSALDQMEIEDSDVLQTSNFRWWLKDKAQREQFMVRFGHDDSGHRCCVYWFDSVTREAEVYIQDEDVTKSNTMALTQREAYWSPLGSYVVTLHPPGARLWGGQKFTSMGRFPHDNVHNVLFSPDEEYVITQSMDHPLHSKLFSLRSGKLVSELMSAGINNRGEKGWPYFQWSSDSKYISYTDSRDLVVMEVPSMKIATDHSGARTPLSCPGCIFEWAPDRAILAIWTPPVPATQTPGRLSMLQFPLDQGDAKPLALRPLFSVESEADMIWHPRGDLFMLKTRGQRKPRGKTRTWFTQLDIFRMREKSIPVDSVQLEEEISCIEFEGGSKQRFAVLGDNKVFFYSVSKKRAGEVSNTEQLTSMDLPKEVNKFKWSPLGTYFVCGSVNTPDGVGLLIFGQLSENNKVDISCREEHNRLREFNWDPSGRMLLSAVNCSLSDTSYRYQDDMGIMIWSFQGRLLYKQPLKNLSICQWRPHPPLLLSAAEIESIQKNMRMYTRKFDEIDDQKKADITRSMLQEKDKAVKAFTDKLAKASQIVRDDPDFAIYIRDRNNFDAASGWKEIIEERAVVISDVIKPVQ